MVEYWNFLFFSVFISDYDPVDRFSFQERPFEFLLPDQMATCLRGSIDDFPLFDVIERLFIELHLVNVVSRL